MELTDEQIANLTPEQVTELENNPDAVAEFLANQTADDTAKAEESGEPESENPEPEEQDSVANDAGEEEEEEAEPVVLNKSGKVIPYEKHKELRVENATLREQLQAYQRDKAELETLRQKQEKAKTPERRSELKTALVKHIESMKEDYPEWGSALDTVNAMMDEERALREAEREEREAEKAAAKAKAETEAAERQRIIDEQVQEAKENNPDLVYWEAHDEDAWKEAMLQDQALMLMPKWSKKSFDERFAEVVKRVRAIMPEASEPPNLTPSAKTREKAKAQLEKAPMRKPTTLSDVQGGGNPVSESEQMDNLTPHQLAAKLMNMPASKAAAMRSRLD